MATERNGMISTTQVGERVGVKMSAEFMESTLGVKPDATDKRASLYTEDTFVKICDAFEAHIAKVRAGNYAPAPAPAKRKEKPKSAAAQAAIDAKNAPVKSFDDDEEDEFADIGKKPTLVAADGDDDEL